MDKKICLRCKEEKELNDFYKDKSRKEGYYSYCKKNNITKSIKKKNKNMTNNR